MWWQWRCPPSHRLPLECQPVQGQSLDNGFLDLLGASNIIMDMDVLCGMDEEMGHAQQVEQC